MLKQRRIEALLAPLAAVIEGIVSDGRLRGRYRGHAVEAWALKQDPSPDMPVSQGTTKAGPNINIFAVSLAGVSGGRFWDCRSSPTLPSSFVPIFSSIFFRLIRTEFKFERPKGEWLAKKLGVPPADAEVQELLRSAGLFEELSLLRSGRHPYLPKVSFNPGAQAVGVAGLASAFKERLGAEGHPGLESVVDEELRASTHANPGKLSVQVEMGKAQALTEERFRELLERVVRVAQINAEANPPEERAVAPE